MQAIHAYTNDDTGGGGNSAQKDLFLNQYSERWSIVKSRVAELISNSTP
jgi:hypothetical protein